MERFEGARSVVECDLPHLRSVLDQTELFPSEMLPEMIAAYIWGHKPDIWFTYELDGVPVAIGFCEPERMAVGTWNLLAIAVLPAHQGRGLGSAMLTYLERRLASQGHRVLIVETMGTEAFGRTRAFYRNNGYVEEARIREFYEPGADKVVFWKHL